MAVRETPEQALERWRQLELLQEHYADFEDLLNDVMTDVLGFKCSDIQIDIGDYTINGPQYRMIQAQRGQAKTTIAAIAAVYWLIHDPKTRILIVSAGDTQATEIANWIIQIINNMPELECLRPDRSNGDRASVEAYDVHYTLKGPEKSPSVACVGITANMQGKRADKLIADDVESQKNSQTQTQRERLKLLTKDFASINSTGDILWLGTPQSIDSVYNDLPGRGYDIRIWPGRYPTDKELENYGAWLAPLIRARLELDPSLGTGGGADGTRGKPIDPLLLSEETLIKKEIDQGSAYFDLQHMLSTKLSDANRFPLKLGQLRILAFDAQSKRAPMTLNFARTEDCWVLPPKGYPITDKMYRVKSADDYGEVQGWHMYVDPAGGGQNGDETAYAITGFLAGRVLLAAVGGVPGGLDDVALDALTAVAMKWLPKTIQIEKNFGNGALSSVWQPKLQAALTKAGKPPCGVEDVWESGQKELRIIDALEPIIGSGKMIVHEDVIHQDWDSVQKYSGEKRSTYSLFWQMARITRDKGSLIHEDRLDALAGAVRPWVALLSIDDEKLRAKAKQDQYNTMVRNPLGNGRPVPGMSRAIGGPNVLTKHGLFRPGR